MSMLQALDRYYGRMAARGEAEELGFTRENIGFALILDKDGSVRDITDLREISGRRLVPRRMSVPRPKRTSNVQANFLWDKTAYAFGVDGGKSKRLSDEHESFKNFHREMLSGVEDRRVEAFLTFLDQWKPEDFKRAPFTADMVDASFVFRFEDEHLYLHQVPALRARWIDSLQEPDAPRVRCLVTGRLGVLETGHPIVKGVEGAQTAGAYLVSFNAAAYTSYNKPQDGSNAPVSKEAAARYGAALNGLLEKSSRNRLPRPIGDATTVFWADAGEAAAQAAEDWFAQMFNPPAAEGEAAGLEKDAQEAASLGDALRQIAAGRPMRDLDLRLSEGVRFHVLGLSPNAARLSVRFWLTDSFEAFAQRLAWHYEDLRIEPAPWRAPPSVARLLVETTVSQKAKSQEKYEKIPPLLAGELTRAILAGTPYPRTLLAAALIRLRAGDDPSTGWHAATIRAVLARHDDRKEPPPVSLDRENPHPAYQLGRMFAMAEIAQRMALGKEVKATIRDRYFGAASATPAGVFPLLLRGMQHHLSRLRKDGKGGFIEREMDQIAAQLPPDLPRSLRLEEQGRFVIGYYHQRKARVGDKPLDEIADEESPKEGDAE
ncbi:type I-C CRISPR-associated protein Cas8c/Csd1 [Roseicella aquatilis]|uniref:Type I-C CRISPR-associated protein Cas8c/Csd1 n=1 Tax=Roseicella aquatilis TaxID=2527868 RepID=A0A4R4D509_9PROT|nr:type I-C CRISPR-associated protein Cas8c/Csd1 [Roseicella aquatilis]TCZ53906.1 type I-C CRISPR-associated protein Cas8c/Csd1 [Roseicella aquatilis]